MLLLQPRVSLAEDLNLDNFADEIKKTEQLLLELDRHEKEIVRGTATNIKSNSASDLQELKNKIIELESQNRALVASMSIKSEMPKEQKLSDKQNDFIKKIIEENRELNSHKERLVEEIIKYRKQLKNYRSTLEQAVEREHRLIGKLQATSGDLREGERRISELSRINSELQDLKKEKEILRVQLAKSQDSLSKLEELLEEKRAAEADNKYLREHLQRAQEKIEQSKSISQTKDDEVKSLKNKIAELNSNISSMQSELSEKEELAKEVSTLRKSMLVMKTDLELKHSQMKTLISGGPGKILPVTTGKEPSEEVKTKAINLTRQDVVTSDVVIAEVIAHKVNLRSGPGDEHSPLMQIMRGAQLVVEDKKGDWYRVISPTGSRAYIKTNVVRLKAGGKTGARGASQNERTPQKPKSTELENKNYNEDLKTEEEEKSQEEDEADAAFRQLRRGVLRDE